MMTKATTYITANVRTTHQTEHQSVQHQQPSTTTNGVYCRFVHVPVAKQKRAPLLTKSLCEECQSKRILYKPFIHSFIHCIERALVAKRHSFFHHSSFIHSLFGNNIQQYNKVQHGRLEGALALVHVATKQGLLGTSVFLCPEQESSL